MHANIFIKSLFFIICIHSSLSTTIVANNTPKALFEKIKTSIPVSFTGPDEICVGETTSLSPSTGGTWITNAPLVATVTNGGLVTGLSEGSATFTFTETATGETGTTTPLTVSPIPNVSITGSDEICIGYTTTLSPSTGGVWSSSNPSIASVNNFGVVTGIDAGFATLTFTSIPTLCSSNSPIVVTVHPRPLVEISGTSMICLGEFTTLSPSTGGTWTSSNPTVATVSNAGIVTGVATGIANFTFTSTITGCSSISTNEVTVNTICNLIITGPDKICIGETSSLFPTTGGTWVSSDNTVATVTNQGIVTGVGAGSVRFTFTETTTGETGITLPLTVHMIPTVSSGSAKICINGTTTLNPSTGGIWIIIDNTYATLSGNTITGVAAGTATLVFQNDETGCLSNTLSIEVISSPDVSIIGLDEICNGETTTLSPTTGGIWTSSSPSIASVNNAGVVTGIDPGNVTFTFTSISTLCSSLPTDIITVHARPLVEITGTSIICVGEMTTISPSTGGTWVSSDPGIATVTNTGVVTGIQSGSVKFTYTNTQTSCVSKATNTVTVNINPTINITGGDQLCIGETTSLTSTTSGVWTSSDTTIATITDLGIVTAISPGAITITHSDSITNCTSPPSDPIVIYPIPQISFNGSTHICVGGNSSILPSIGGTWSSADATIATITNAGIITGVSPGITQFTFVDGTTLCPSITSEYFYVGIGANANINGPTIICINDTTTIEINEEGTWYSNNPEIASITNDGIVIGLSSGITSFYFEYNDQDCGTSQSDTITILEASDPNCTTGIADIAGASIQIFPNPSQDVIHIKGIKANTSINLISMDGKILRMKNNYNKEESIINVHQLPIGIYILEIIMEDNHIMKRISVLR